MRCAVTGCGREAFALLFGDDYEIALCAPHERRVSLAAMERRIASSDWMRSSWWMADQLRLLAEELRNGMGPEAKP